MTDNSGTKHGAAFPILLSVLLFCACCYCCWIIWSDYRAEAARTRARIESLVAERNTLASQLKLDPCEAAALLEKTSLQPQRNQ